RLGFNNLTGSIPSSISALTALTFVDLSYNQLSGPVSAVFGRLTPLEFNIEGNDITCPADNTSCGQTPLAKGVLCQKCATFCITCQRPT
ncbi:unnamed protein product, partial [Closterium sp. NIES-54]